MGKPASPLASLFVVAVFLFACTISIPFVPLSFLVFVRLQSCRHAAVRSEQSRGQWQDFTCVGMSWYEVE